MSEMGSKEWELSNFPPEDHEEMGYWAQALERGKRAEMSN